MNISATLPKAAAAERRREVEWWLLALVLAVGVALRAWLLWRTPLVPGINGAYYLIQARSLLEKGALAIPDLPLTFLLTAAVSRTLAACSGWPLEAAILAAVKTLDALLPPLAAVPIFALVRRWSPRPWPALLAALAVAAGPGGLFMVGDFQKNALGLVWLAALLWSLHAWLAAPAPHRALLVLLLLALVGVTHIGVLGTALLLATLIVGAQLVHERGSALARTLSYLLAAALILAAVGALVAWKFDPARIHRLIGAVTRPAHFFAGGMAPMPLPGGGGGMLRWLPAVLLAGLGSAALGLAYRRRHLLPGADFALVAGCALGVIALTGPWVQGDKVPRFYLNAGLPIILIASFTILQCRRRAVQVTLGVLGSLLVLGGDVPLVLGGGMRLVDPESVRELTELRPLIPDPARTLVVAMHGQEWWAAWVLHTHIAHFEALRPEDWQRYDVLFLEGRAAPLFGPGPPPPRAGPGLPGMRPPEIPPDAQVLYRSKNWTLARVANAVAIPRAPAIAVTARPPTSRLPRRPSRARRALAQGDKRSAELHCGLATFLHRGAQLDARFATPLQRSFETREFLRRWPRANGPQRIANGSAIIERSPADHDMTFGVAKFQPEQAVAGENEQRGEAAAESGAEVVVIRGQRRGEDEPLHVAALHAHAHRGGERDFRVKEFLDRARRHSAGAGMISRTAISIAGRLSHDSVSAVE